MQQEIKLESSFGVRADKVVHKRALLFVLESKGPTSSDEILY